MKIQYFNPKSCKYLTVNVIKIDGDVVLCQHKYGHTYTESLQQLKNFTIADNPNWHGQVKKPLIKLIGF